MAKLNFFLNFAGNTEKAFSFYKSVFRRELGPIIRFKDMPKESGKVPKQEENKILLISLPLDKDSVLIASDTLESRRQKIIQGNNIYISVSPESKGEADRIFESLSAGGYIRTPLSDQPWHAYYGSLIDKYGVAWMVNYEYSTGGKKAEPVTKSRMKAKPAPKTKTKAALPPKKKAKATPPARNKVKPVRAVKRKAKPIPAGKIKVKALPAVKRKLKATAPPKKQPKAVPVPKEKIAPPPALKNKVKARTGMRKAKQKPVGIRPGKTR